MVYGGLIELLLDLRLVLLICFVSVFFNLFKRLSIHATQIPFYKIKASSPRANGENAVQGLKAKSLGASFMYNIRTRSNIIILKQEDVAKSSFLFTQLALQGRGAVSTGSNSTTTPTTDP